MASLTYVQLVSPGGQYDPRRGSGGDSIWGEELVEEEKVKLKLARDRW